MTATLFHAPLACSLATLIAATEAEVPLDIACLDLTTKRIETGGSLLDHNPLGQVSVLRLDSGEILTETATCIAWVQAQSRNGFAIAPSDRRYFQMLRWLNFCATELHKQIFRVVFYPEATDEVKDRIRALAPQRFELLDAHLADRPFLLGERFSAADAYLTWFFVLSDRAGVDVSAYGHLNAYRARTLARPAVAAVIEQDRKRAKRTF